MKKAEVKTSIVLISGILIIVALLVVIMAVNLFDKPTVTVNAINPPNDICNSPYIRVGTECCLDKNNNKICDHDDIQSSIENTVTADVNSDDNNQMQENGKKVLVKTDLGDIVIELYPDKAPITVANFLSYVNDNTYDGTVFHRVIKGFMIQGGGYTPDGNEKPTKEPITLESDNGLKNDIGTVAMARTNVPDSATSQFFINTANNQFLNKGISDEGYAVFGKVIKGMDIVNKIENAPTGTKYGTSDWPVQDIKINSISVIE